MYEKRGKKRREALFSYLRCLFVYGTLTLNAMQFFCIGCPARSANVAENIRCHLKNLKVVSISRKMSKMRIWGGW